MPKSLLSFNPADYALVADRITLFYERYPDQDHHVGPGNKQRGR